jgi:hypothetical protein
MRGEFPLTLKGRESPFSPMKKKKALAELFQDNVDITLGEIREKFGKNCSLVAIHKTIVKLGFVFKKLCGQASWNARAD